MTLRDLIAADTANVILNTNDFAESVTVYRKRGGQESVTAVTFEAVEYIDGEHVVEKQSVLTVTAAETLNLQVGDSVRRATDPADARWMFDGAYEVLDGMASYRCVRLQPAQYGSDLYGREV